MEHGNFSTKDGENRRVWKNSQEAYKQLFRLLRFQSSPILQRLGEDLAAEKRKVMTCSRCAIKGHKRTSRKCQLVVTEENLTEVDETDVEVNETDVEVNVEINVTEADEPLADEEEFMREVDFFEVATEEDGENIESSEFTIVLDEDDNIEQVDYDDSECPIS